METKNLTDVRLVELNELRHMGDREFALLGELAKSTWEDASGDRSVWEDFVAEAQDLRNASVRWFLDGTGEIVLIVEQYATRADAHRANRRSGTTVVPLRRLVWRWTGEGWIGEEGKWK